jgi:hypothetical protein
MPILQKCPTCGSFAFVQLDGNFKCENGHIFKLTKQEKTGDGEVWEHMPPWTRKLRETSRRLQN